MLPCADCSLVVTMVWHGLAFEDDGGLVEGALGDGCLDGGALADGCLDEEIFVDGCADEGMLTDRQGNLWLFRYERGLSGNG